MAEPAVVVVPQIKIRECLRCSGKFPSQGPHNRLCNDCRETIAKGPTPEETYDLVLHQLT